MCSESLIDLTWFSTSITDRGLRPRGDEDDRDRPRSLPADGHTGAMTNLYIALPKADGYPITVHREAESGDEHRAACGARSDNFVRYSPLGHPRDERYCARCAPDGVIAR